MIETAQPTVLGSVDLATAQRWSEMEDSSQADLASERAHIQGIDEEMGRVAIEEGGLVVVVDEEGKPTGKAVFFDKRNLGDNYKDYGKGDSSTDSIEAEAGKPAVDLESLKKDPNLLLKPEILGKVLGLDPATTDNPEDADALKKRAERDIIGPEQAAVMVGEIVGRTAKVTIEEVQTLLRVVGNIEPGSEFTSALEAADVVVGEVKNAFYNLQYRVRSGEPLDESAVYAATKLAENAAGYARYHRALEDTAGASASQGARVVNQAEEVSSYLRRGKGQAEGDYGSSMAGVIDTGRTEEVKQKVTERGAQSLEEHGQRASQECINQLDMISDAMTGLSRTENLSQDLLASLRSRSSYLEELPSYYQLNNVADGLRESLVRLAAYGPRYMSQVEEEIGAMSAVLGRFEEALGAVKAKNAATQKLIEDTKSQVRRVLGLPLYEAA